MSLEYFGDSIQGRTTNESNGVFVNDPAGSEEIVQFLPRKHHRRPASSEFRRL